MSCGIYCITNCVNGSKYVGMSKDILRRWCEHVTPKYLKKNTSIARAFRKYGVAAFAWEILEECQIKELASREIFWIARMNPRYNRTSGGEGTVNHKVSKKVRMLLSVKGRQQWARMTIAQQDARIKNNLTGRKNPHSQKTKDLLRDKNLGKKHSEETKRKMSQSHKLRCERIKHEQSNNRSS